MRTNNQKNIWDNSFVIFFILPILFFFIVSIMGFHMFYNRKKTKFEKKRIFLLSSGALFYGILIIYLYFKFK